MKNLKKFTCMMMFACVFFISSGKMHAADLTVKYIDLTNSPKGYYFRVTGTGSFKYIRVMTQYKEWISIASEGGLFPNGISPLGNYRYVEVTYDASVAGNRITGVTTYDQSGSKYVASYNTIIDTLSPPIAPKIDSAIPDVQKVTLSWTGAGATSYKLYLDGVEVSSNAKSPYTFDLPEIRKYNFAVVAVNQFGESTKATVTLAPLPVPKPPDKTPPAVPVLSGLSKLSAAHLSWTASPDDDLYIYKLYMDDIFQDSYPKSATNADIGSLDVGKKYVFRISAVDLSGNESEKSNPIEIIPTKNPPPKPVLRLRFNAAYTEILADWDASSDPYLEKYVLQVGGKEVLSGPELGYKISTIKENETYDFSLVAVDRFGTASQPATGRLTAPKRSTESNQSPTDEGLVVSWSKTEGSTGYIVMLNGREITRVGPEVRSYTITKEQGYNPALLTNNGSVKPIYADGSTGGAEPGNPTKPVSMDFIGVKPMLQTAIAFLSIYGSWILLVLAVIFVYVFIGPITRWISYAAQKSALSKKRGW